MGFDIERLIADIQDIYGTLKKTSYPDLSLLSRYDKYSGKSAVDSVEARNLGNVEYKKGNNYAALKLYMKSIALATSDGLELAFAFGNRSAVLFQLGKYALALLDVNRALDGNYPDSSEAKLLNREKECLNKIKAMKKDKNRGDEPDENDFPRNFRNSLLPGTSSKVKLACSEKWGRHMIAAKDIEPGEILSCEEYFSTYLAYYRRHMNCSYCFMRCEALIPCSSCCRVMYCSDQCRTRAFHSYHRIECRMWSFYQLEKFDAHPIMAVQTLLVGMLQNANLENLVENMDVKDVFKEKVDPTNQPFRKDYQSVLRHLWQFDKPPKHEVKLAVKAVMMLQKLTFFVQNNLGDREGNQTDCLNKTELFTTLALINHIRSVRWNNSAIFETSKNNDQHKIGLGVPVLNNLLNHSCDPNVHDFMRGREHVYFSLRPIREGEQLFISYCDSYAQAGLAYRREYLSNYGFICRCKACIHDWPLMEVLQPLPYESLITDMKILGKVMHYNDTMFLNRKVDGDDEVGQIKTLREAIKCRKLLQGNFKEPSVACESLIGRYMRKTYGHFYLPEQENWRKEEDYNVDLDCSNLNSLLETSVSKIRVISLY